MIVEKDDQRVKSMSKANYRLQEWGDVNGTLNLMRTIVKEDVNSGETKMLINAAEFLTKEGIQGQIAQIGVGFGTGRHTSTRKYPPILPPTNQYPEIARDKKFIRKLPNTPLRLT
jgi:hypothetical protein